VLRSLPGGRVVSEQLDDEVRRFLDCAGQCRLLAERAGSPDVRALYLNLALQWEILAQHVKQAEGSEN
jgi:hypothetical protein